jgi:hypothetical protein
MTLILSIATRDYGLQVGDRLLTQQVTRGRTKQYEPWDVYANKAIVLNARDGLIAMSFSGQAHINRIPTDDWLVSTMFGEDPCPTLDGRRGIRQGPAPRVWTLGKYIDHVSTELTKARRAGKIKDTSGITLIGLRWHREKNIAFPCFGYIRWNVKAGAFRCCISKRYWGWESRTRHAHVMALGRSEKRAQQLLIDRASGADLSDPMVVEKIMTEIIRRVADDDASVGRDCMSILLKRTPPHIHIQYRPYALDKIPLALQGKPMQVPAAFSPWIATPSITSPPLIIVGQGWSFAAGDFTVQVDSPPPGMPLAWLKTMPQRMWP